MKRVRSLILVVLALGLLAVPDMAAANHFGVPHTATAQPRPSRGQYVAPVPGVAAATPQFGMRDHRFDGWHHGHPYPGPYPYVVPQPQWVWQPGYWNWNGQQWFWTPSRWVQYYPY
jgi:hypothetical protein